MKPHFSKAHGRCACFLGINEGKLNIMKKWKRNDFVFSQNANFLITDEQEVI